MQNTINDNSKVINIKFNPSLKVDCISSEDMPNELQRYPDLLSNLTSEKIRLSLSLQFVAEAFSDEEAEDEAEVTIKLLNEIQHFVEQNQFTSQITHLSFFYEAGQLSAEHLKRCMDNLGVIFSQLTYLKFLDLSLNFDDNTDSSGVMNSFSNALMCLPNPQQLKVLTMDLPRVETSETEDDFILFLKRCTGLVKLTVESANYVMTPFIHGLVNFIETHQNLKHFLFQSESNGADFSLINAALANQALESLFFNIYTPIFADNNAFVEQCNTFSTKIERHSNLHVLNLQVRHPVYEDCTSVSLLELQPLLLGIKNNDSLKFINVTFSDESSTKYYNESYFIKGNQSCDQPQNISSPILFFSPSMPSTIIRPLELQNEQETPLYKKPKI